MAKKADIDSKIVKLIKDGKLTIFLGGPNEAGRSHGFFLLPKWETPGKIGLEIRLHNVFWMTNLGNLIEDFWIN
jgi:hypothetical protein